MLAMRRWLVMIAAGGFGVLLLVWATQETPKSLLSILFQPLRALAGSQERLNATLLEVSETAEPVRSAGRKLLQPFGALRLIRTFPAKDEASSPH